MKPTNAWSIDRDPRLVDTIDIFYTEWGSIEILPDRWQLLDQITMIDPKEDSPWGV